MQREQMIDLDDCSEFRQTLQARPPRIVHGTILLLVLLIIAAAVWSSATTASLVVRAPGRVRPVSTPTGVSAAFGTRINGRVIEVNYREGDAVCKGQLLIRFDTGQLDNDIARHSRTVRSLEDELDRLADLRDVRRDRSEVAQAKAEAELNRAAGEVDHARAARETAVRLAEIDRKDAEQRLSRMRKLFERQALSRADLMEAETAFQRAEEKLVEAQRPVDATGIAVARHALELVDRNSVAEQMELEVQRVTREGELLAVRQELAGLQLERNQSVLYSPLDGIVITPALKMGDVVERGKPVLKVAARLGFHFEAAVASADVGHLRPGMPVRIRFDAFDHQEYGTAEGTVCFISPDSTIPEQAQNTPPVYFVRVELLNDTLHRRGRRGAIKLGMTGHSEIVTGQESVLHLLLQRIRGTISFG